MPRIPGSHSLIPEAPSKSLQNPQKTPQVSKWPTRVVLAQVGTTALLNARKKLALQSQGKLHNAGQTNGI